MFGNLIKKVVGTKNDRELGRLSPMVDRISDLEKTMGSLTDAQLQAKTVQFKEQLAQGASIDDLLPDRKQGLSKKREQKPAKAEPEKFRVVSTDNIHNLRLDLEPL